MLREIELKNFRNYGEMKLNFNKNIIIFTGNNAQGKTNILESIYVLGITKSHRNFKDENLIKKGEDFFKVKAKTSSNDLEIIYSKKGKVVKKDNNIVKKLSDYINNLNVIMFCPDDLELIKGSPAIRRTYLNVEITQYDSKYLQYLSKYNECLKQRNNYLKKVDAVDQDYLNIITDELIGYAVEIYLYRNKYVCLVNDKIADIYKFVMNDEKLFIKYINYLDGTNKEEIFIELKEKFKRVLDRELIVRQTLVGPHKDDIEFWLNDKNLKLFGSQGQQRASVLSFKLAEVELFFEKNNDYPLLLLDDIFSEFDVEKRKKIIDYLENKAQTFITTTEKDIISDKSENYEIKNGEIEKLEFRGEL